MIFTPSYFNQIEEAKSFTYRKRFPRRSRDEQLAKSELANLYPVYINRGTKYLKISKSGYSNMHINVSFFL